MQDTYTAHQKVYNVIRIAGGQYADTHAFWNDLQVGDRLYLKPDPFNSYDPNAVIVFHGSDTNRIPNIRIGYIAREAGTNVEIAKWLQLGAEYECILIRKDPKAHPYSQLFCKVTFTYYTKTPSAKQFETPPLQPLLSPLSETSQLFREFEKWLQLKQRGPKEARATSKAKLKKK